MFHGNPSSAGRRDKFSQRRGTLSTGVSIIDLEDLSMEDLNGEGSSLTMPAAQEAVTKMPSSSAGIILYRRRAKQLEVLLVHPGGPFWRRKDDGAWSIPKGELGGGEDPAGAARRELREELGVSVEGPLLVLGEVRQRGGKHVHAFAIEQDFDVSTLRSNLFEIEWPPKSGTVQSFPEVDRAEWFELSLASGKILASQRPLLERLAGLVE
jgi:predicted NUDIX family NTP pyrophosphohydrolase